MDDFLKGLLIVMGVVALGGLALIGLLMWRFKIPPRGVVAMVGALTYLVLPIDVLPEAVLGPLGMVDDTGVLVGVSIWIYRLVKARQKLVDGGVITRR